MRDVSVTAEQLPISSSVSKGQLSAMEAVTSSVTAKQWLRYKTDKYGMLGKRSTRTRKEKQNWFTNAFLKMMNL